MLAKINSNNKGRVKASFTAEESRHVYGYEKSVTLTPKNARCIFEYQIDDIKDMFVCTIRRKDIDTIEAVVVFRNYTADGIEIDKADLYRNCSNYPYRTETSSRYLAKYDQIACIVHGAITDDLLIACK